MKKEVKIILFPEEHKSKNGVFFENLIRNLFSNEYEIDQNINFTGLEIDIFGKNKRRDETLIIECKAKQKPQSEEVKNFAYNVLISRKADFGYFLHTEELDHQAGGVAKELLANQEYRKKVSFLGPKEIIEILVEKNIAKPIEQIELPNGLISYRCTLAYTYFGLFYILVASETTNADVFYLFNAKTLEEINDISIPASEEHSTTLTIDQVLRTNIPDIKNKLHKILGIQNPKINILSDVDQIQTFAEISEEFKKEINSPSVVFSHSNVNEILISDIFTSPDLKYISAEKDTQNQVYKNLLDIADGEYKNGIRYVMLGEDCSGRTTICKYLFQRYYSQGFIPILLHASEINNLRTDAIVKLVSRVFKLQYNSGFNFASYPREKILLLIDDFHKIPNKNREFWGILVKNINIAFENVIITGSTLMPLESVVNKKNRIRQNVFQEYDVYVLSELGHKLRSKLINKWNILGLEENLIDKNELFRKNDTAFQYVQSIIGNNYVPAYPFYILTILQALETGNSQNPNYSLHGFYYELIINDALARAVKDKKEISLYYNYLTYFCYYLFEQKTKQMFINDFKQFHKSYCEKFDIKYSPEKILSSLNSAKLILVNNEISVPYKYVYYFFVAKYLTNNINKSETKEIISKICQRTYRDEYASIIMFLSHLSKDEFIINTLLQNARSIFSEYQIAQLGSDITSINDLVKELPKQVIKQISVEDARDEELEDKDEIEKMEKDFEQQSHEEQEFDLNEDIDTIGIFAKITHAFKTVELLGQVAKKYWGEMPGEKKYEITSETYFLGLRTLGFYLTFMQENQDFLINHIKNIIEKKHIKDLFSLKKSVEETASDFIFRLCFLASWGTVKRISGAVGYEKLNSTYEAVLEKNQYNSVKLITLSIKLDHYDKFPYKEIEITKNELEKNKLSYLMLRNLVIDYLYMFDTTREIRQRICSLLDIQIKDQLRITQSSRVKK